MDHARLGCSGAYRWMACPGSVNFEGQFPGSSSPAAAEGTIAHEVHELALLAGMTAAQVYPYIPGATTEMADHVQASIDWILRELAERPGATLLVESRLNPGAEIGRDDLWGTGDAVILDPERNEVLIIDLKYGFGVVNVETTPQLRLYALGAKRLADFPAERFILVIAQPRAPHVDGLIRQAAVTLQELNAFRDKIQEAASRADDPDAPLIAGDHCTFCRAAGACPTLGEYSLQAARDEFARAFAPEPVSDTGLAYALNKVATIKEWIRAAEAEALRRAEAGATLPGWKPVPRKGHRAWDDEGFALDTLLGDYDITPEDLAPRKLKSPRQVELTIKEKLGVKANLSGLVSTPQLGMKLVPDTAPEDDPFEAAEHEFAHIDFDS